MRHLPNDSYMSLKWIGMIVLPFVGTAYFLLGEVVAWPRVKEVVAFLMIGTLIVNAVLWWSTKRYLESDARFDGYITLEEDPGGIKKVNMEIEGDPETLLLFKKEITFQVKRH